MTTVDLLPEGECSVLPLGHNVTGGMRVCSLLCCFVINVYKLCWDQLLVRRIIKISRGKVKKSEIREIIGVICESRMKRITILT